MLILVGLAMCTYVTIVKMMIQAAEIVEDVIDYRLERTLTPVAAADDQDGDGTISEPAQLTDSSGLNLSEHDATGNTNALHLHPGKSACRHIQTYGDLCVATFGPCGMIITDLNIVFLNVGACSAYLVILGDVGPEILKSVFGPETLLVDRTGATLFLTAVFITPLLLPRSITFLSRFSLLSIVSVATFVVVVVASAPSPWAVSRSWGERHLQLTRWDASDIFRCLPLMGFAFTCHTNVFPIYSELADAQPATMSKVVSRSLAICLCLYAIVGVFGYMTYGNDTQSDLLLNFGHGSMASSGRSISSGEAARWRKDVPHVTEGTFRFVQALYCVSVILTYPLGLYPARQSLTNLVIKFCCAWDRGGAGVSHSNSSSATNNDSGSDPSASSAAVAAGQTTGSDGACYGISKSRDYTGAMADCHQILGAAGTGTAGNLRGTGGIRGVSESGDMTAESGDWGAAATTAAVAPVNYSLHAVLTVILLFVTIVIAIALPGLDSVFGLTGATCTVVVTYVMPSAILLKARRMRDEEMGAVQDTAETSTAPVLVIVLGLLIAVTGTVSIIHSATNAS